MWRYSEKLEYIGSDPRHYLVVYLEEDKKGKLRLVVKTSLGDHVYETDLKALARIKDVFELATAKRDDFDLEELGEKLNKLHEDMLAGEGV